MTKPLVGVPCCIRKTDEGGVYHQIGHKYLAAVASAADCVPVGIPALPEEVDADVLLDRLDGLFLTGSPSNVEPFNYEGPEFREGTLRDPARDGVTLPLNRKAIARGLPIFAVCRGQQEVVAAQG